MDDVLSRRHIYKSAFLCAVLMRVCRFGERFSIVTIRPDGDGLMINLIPQLTRSPSIAWPEELETGAGCWWIGCPSGIRIACCVFHWAVVHLVAIEAVMTNRR